MITLIIYFFFTWSIVYKSRILIKSEKEIDFVETSSHYSAIRVDKIENVTQFVESSA